MYQKQFSSEKIQIHKRKRPNSNLVFFSEIKKKPNLEIWFFFSEKKSKFEGEKKPRKKFSKLKFGFFHMDGPNMLIPSKIQMKKN